MLLGKAINKTLTGIDELDLKYEIGVPKGVFLYDKNETDLSVCIGYLLLKDYGLSAELYLNNLYDKKEIKQSVKEMLDKLIPGHKKITNKSLFYSYDYDIMLEGELAELTYNEINKNNRAKLTLIKDEKKGE